MPWEECTVMDQKIKFIARLLKGEQMAPLSREFGITRPTGYPVNPYSLFNPLYTLDIILASSSSRGFIFIT
jgi:hypothetical protein